jgi:hypothetical protein
MSEIQPIKVKTVSYSQFSLYANCPRRWKLDYLDGLRVYEQSIHTIFGTCMHATIQDYIRCLLTETVKKADEMDLYTLLKETMFKEYKESLVKNGNKHYTTPKELAEFYEDGVAIIEYFRKHRSEFFNAKHHELVGIELPLRYETVNNITFIGFIDFIIKDTRDNTYVIYDLKTSTAGWNKYQKADITKTAQLVLYKHFYAKQFGVEEDDIHVEYIIVRRKINEDLEFRPKRIQTFAPASGKPTRNKVNKIFLDFVQSCFTEQGEYVENKDFAAIASSSCNYCPYKTNEELCPRKQRLKKVKDE